MGCLSAEANNTWALVRAGNLRPVESRIVDGTTPEELKVSAAQPLGTQTFPLLSVTQHGASYAGHKVQVKGVLTRQNTLERINVMSLESVASTCGGERMRAFIFSFFLAIVALVATHDISAPPSPRLRRTSSIRRRFARRTIDSPESGNWSARKRVTRKARSFRGVPTSTAVAVLATSRTTRPATWGDDRVAFTGRSLRGVNRRRTKRGPRWRRTTPTGGRSR